MNQVRIQAFFLLLLLPILSNAQQELNLHTLSNVWQSNRLNPAIMPSNGLTIGLPSVYNGLSISNVTLNDLLGENEAGESIITLSQAIDKLDVENKIQNNFSLETLSFDFRLKNDMHLSLHHATRFNVGVNYPKTLAELLWQGNAAYIGESVDFATDLQLIGYHEFGIGLATALGEKVTLGAKVKLLNGIGHVGTNNGGSLNLYTDDDIYQLSLDADYQINSSAFLDYDGFDELSFNLPFSELRPLDLVSKNVGIAFDIGATFQFNKGNIGVSLLDMGGIRWRTNVANYSLEGVYEYDGLDIVRDYLDGELSFENATDELLASFDVVEDELAYSTALAPKLYTSISYEVLPKMNMSAIFYGEWQQKEFLSAVGLNAQFQATDWLSLGTAYSIYDGGYSSLGFNANAQLGPVQLFAITNNIGAAFNSRDSHTVDFRLGMNILLKRDDKEQE